MTRTPLAMLTAALLFGAAAAHGQNSTRQMLKANTTPTVIPVWNVHSGQIEALLVLEKDPQTQGRAWVRSARGSNPVWQAQGKGVNFDNGMAIFCSGQPNAFSQLSVLDSCQFGKKSTRYPAINSPGLETKALLQRKAGASDLGLLGLSPKERRLLSTEFDNPAAAVPGKGLSLSAGKATDGWVEINGSLARARLIPAAQFPKGVPTEWDAKTFEIPERKRSISGEVVGNVVTIPGQDANIQSIGAGVSWKTPWKGKVSVGAESLLSQGRSSLDMDNSASAPITDQRIDGVRPYVRVEIDL